MGENSKIEWCHHTFNPWLGCAKVAPGCKSCYAEALVTRWHKAAWGPNGTRVKTSESYWRQPLKWNRQAEKAGERRVFCASLADVFEDWEGSVLNSRGETLAFAMDTIRTDLFAMIDATPWLDWLLLTKRPQNIQRMWPSVSGTEHYDPLPESFRKNVWLGTSVANQSDADKNIPELLKCRDLAPVLFVSYEPAIGPVTFDRFCRGGPPHWLTSEIDHPEDATLDWLIFGGESGPGARPCDVAWARSTVNQCREAGVACFVKQLGANCREVLNPADGEVSSRVRLRDGKGGDPSEWPEDLRVRQFPQAEIVA